jgi:hypothetical protein
LPRAVRTRQGREGQDRGGVHMHDLKYDRHRAEAASDVDMVDSLG